MNCTEINQSALVVSAGTKHPDDIIKLIVGADINHINSFKIQDEGMVLTSYPWHLNTKYYEADIHLCSVLSKGLLPQRLASSVQAVILYFDSNINKGLEVAEGWLPFINEYNAEVSILLCNRCLEEPGSGTGVTKIDAQEWCVKRGFELVELDPEIDHEWEAEQDFIETIGIKRIVQALHAHIWPHLNMKDRKDPTSFTALLHGGSPYSENSSLSDDLRELSLRLDDENIEGKIEELLGGGLSSEGNMDFQSLFGQLQEMKERVSTMSSDQRKACAEQVVLAFWKAIGGDNEEIDMPEDG